MKKKLYLFVICCCGMFSANAQAMSNAFSNDTYTPFYYDFHNDKLRKLSNQDNIDDQINGKILADPLEFINKPIFDFNMLLDTAFGEPIVNSYRLAIPEGGRKHISMFLDNLSIPLTFINDILQGDVKGAHNSFWRFFLNSTFGLCGLIDFATASGLDNHKRDFDTTLNRWGIPTGPYIVMPLLGPTTLRGAGAKYVDLHLDPLYISLGPKWRRFIKYPRMINTRSENNDLILLIKYKSIDPYTKMKSLYSQAAKK